MTFLLRHFLFPPGHDRENWETRVWYGYKGKGALFLYLRFCMIDIDCTYCGIVLLCTRTNLLAFAATDRDSRTLWFSTKIKRRIEWKTWKDPGIPCFTCCLVYIPSK